MKRYASSTYLNDIPLLKKGNTLIKNLPLSNFPNDNTLKYRIPSFWFQQIQDEDPQIRLFLALGHTPYLPYPCNR
jgi:hypothetical protein